MVQKTWYPSLFSSYVQFITHRFPNWEEIVGPSGPAAVADPEPSPWRTVAFQLVEAAQAKDLAAHMPPGAQKSAVLKSASVAIEAILDEWCGTPPRHPWPWPGPSPWILNIVSELSLIANSFQAGGLRDEILNIAGHAAARAGGEAR